MGLESLFEDRKRRRYFQEGIYEAKERGMGVCSGCNEEATLLEVFEMGLCESCCDTIIRLANETERDIPKPDLVDESFVMNLLNEAVTVYFDMARLQQEADKNYDGDLKKLFKAYKCSILKLQSDRVAFQTATTSSGKSSVNQLIIDFDGEFGSDTGAMNTVPDHNGVVAPKRVRGKGIITGTSTTSSTTSSTTTATQVPPVPSVKSVNVKASSTQSVSTVAPSKTTIASTVSPNNTTSGGDVTNASFTMGGEVEVSISLEAPSNPKRYLVGFSVGGKEVGHPMSVHLEKNGSEKSLIEELKKTFVKDPDEFFDSFVGNYSGRYSLLKYEKAEFAFDEKSFEKKITMVSIENGKPSKDRYEIPWKALFNSSELAQALTKLVDEKIKDKYPALFDGSNEVKTSIGKAVFTFSGSKDGSVALKVDWAGTLFDGFMDGQRLINKQDAKRAFAEILLNNIEKVAKDFDITKTRISFDEPEYSVRAEFLPNEMDDFAIAFKISIGVGGSKFGGDIYVYRKPGVSVNDFIQNTGKEIYNSLVKLSPTMMTSSATEKMKNKSKKQTILRKLADKVGWILRPDVRLSEVDIDSESLEFEVDVTINAVGGVTGAEVLVHCEDSSPEDVKKLAEYFEKKSVNWLKLDTIKKARNTNTMVFTVKDIAEFADSVQLHVVESALLEAYGISKRRMTFIV